MFVTHVVSGLLRWQRYIGEDASDVWYVDLKKVDAIHAQKEPPVNFELKIVEELQATELTYVRKLRQLVQMYSKPLQQMAAGGSPLMSTESWRMIFGNTESICALAENFYDLLTVRKAGKAALTWPHEVVLEAFTSLLAFFKLYSSYFDKYQQGTERLLNEAATNEALCEFLHAAQARLSAVTKRASASATPIRAHSRLSLTLDRGVCMHACVNLSLIHI